MKTSHTAVFVIVALCIALQVDLADAKSKNRDRKRRKCPHSCVRRINSLKSLRGQQGPPGPPGSRGPPGPPGPQGLPFTLPACKFGEYLTSDGVQLRCEKLNLASVCSELRNNCPVPPKKDDPGAIGIPGRQVNASDKMVKFMKNNMIQSWRMDAWDVDAFYIGDLLFFGLSQLGGAFEIYKWQSSTDGFVQYQQFKIVESRYWEPFTIGDDTYLVVAALARNEECPTFKWNKQTAKFDKFKAGLACNHAFDVEPFRLNGVQYIAVANYERRSRIVIYRWNGNSFYKIQDIDLWAMYVTAFEVQGNTYLGVSGVGGRSEYVYLYKWNGQKFTLSQRIYTVGRSYELTAITVGKKTFISIATLNSKKPRAQNAVVLFEWNGKEFVGFQNITSVGARRVTAISNPIMGKDITYLAVINYFDHPVIYVWDRDNSDRFVVLHHIEAKSTRDISFFEMNNNVYLLLASHNLMEVYKGAMV